MTDSAALRGALAGSVAKRASDRYALLVHLLGERMGNVHGWKVRAAAELGVHASYISKVLAGELGMIGPEIIVRAAERLGLPAEFFVGEREPTSQDFERHRRTTSQAIPAIGEIGAATSALAAACAELAEAHRVASIAAAASRKANERVEAAMEAKRQALLDLESAVSAAAYEATP